MAVLGGLISTLGFVMTCYVRSIWLMYLTFGVISGIGYGFSIISAVVSIAFWFEKHRILALGIAASGTGFGTIIYSPLMIYLLGKYEWRGTVLLMAGIGANMCASGLLMREPQWILEEQRKSCMKEKSAIPLVPKTKYEIADTEASLAEPERDTSNSLIELTTFLHEHEEEWYDDDVEVLKDITNLSLFNELHFLLLGVSTVIMCSGFVVPFFYLPVHMTIYGYSESAASFVLAVIGGTNIIGMVFFLLTGDILNVVKVYALCLIGCGLTCIAMIWFTSNYGLLLISCGLFGLFSASINTLTPSILGNLVYLDNFTMAYGMFLMCQGIGNLAGPPIAGLLYDLTQSYEQSFYLAGFWVVFSGLLVGLIAYTRNMTIWK